MGNNSSTRGYTDRQRVEDLNKATASEYSRQERKLIKLYLKDFVCSRPSNRQELNIVLHHWESLTAPATGHGQSPQDPSQTRVAEMCDRFHQILSEFAPELTPLFHSSFQFKGRMLMNIIGGIKSLLQTRDTLERATRIAQRHVTYGVKSTHFNLFGRAFLQTLQEAAPELYTRQAAHAWRSVFCHVATLVLVSLEKEPRTSGRSAAAKHSAELVNVDPAPQEYSLTNQPPLASPTNNKQRRSSMSDLQHAPVLTNSVMNIPYEQSGGGGDGSNGHPSVIARDMRDQLVTTKQDGPRSFPIRRHSAAEGDAIVVVEALPTPSNPSGADLKMTLTESVWVPFRGGRSSRVGVDPTFDETAHSSSPSPSTRDSFTISQLCDAVDPKSTLDL